MTNQGKQTHIDGSSGAVHLKDKAFRDLELMIVNGTLEPGQWVSESDLMELSGHTRAPVRSAIQRLADEALLRIVPRRGAQICPIDYTEQFRALELRRVVERLVAQSAAKRATADQRKKFAELAKRFRKLSVPDDQDMMTELDTECFSLLITASDNKFAARALTSVKGLSRRFWILHQQQYGSIKRIAAVHAAVAHAISEGDEEGADKAVRVMIDYIEEFTLEVVGFNPARSRED